ncbi:MAG: hypothetical protein J6E49_04385 [Acidaminococcaceae bacterium]|nr:hypothetical protein [Acidaminococcaceae bacterium]MBQ5346194.1 hypothetical protein [Acidaminococcaceae bacterium]
MYFRCVKEAKGVKLGSLWILTRYRQSKTKGNRARLMDAFSITHKGMIECDSEFLEEHFELVKKYREGL